MSDKFTKSEDGVITLTPFEKTDNDSIIPLDIDSDSILRSVFDLESDEGLDAFSDFIGDVITDLVKNHENTTTDSSENTDE